MNDEQINAAIAEACGWKRNPKCGWYPDNGWNFGTQNIHDYCNDLNSMHEAEKVIVSEWNPFYATQLARVTNSHYSDDPSFFCATARQRAEAFLRTLGKWEEAG